MVTPDEGDYLEIVEQLADWQIAVHGRRDPQLVRNADHMKTLVDLVKRQRNGTNEAEPSQATTLCTGCDQHVLLYKDSLCQECYVAQLERIVDDIPALVELVASDCGREYIDRPTVYKRGTLWRYHAVRAGNNWNDAVTPLLAARLCRKWG